MIQNVQTVHGHQVGHQVKVLSVCEHPIRYWRKVADGRYKCVVCAELEALRARVVELEEQAAVARAALERVPEWRLVWTKMDGGIQHMVSVCLWCMMKKDVGHASDCGREIAIRSLSGKLEVRPGAAPETRRP